jgi:hypothetical protein
MRRSEIGGGDREAKLDPRMRWEDESGGRSGCLWLFGSDGMMEAWQVHLGRIGKVGSRLRQRVRQKRKGIGAIFGHGRLRMGIERR